jgi:hypothetical protein
MNIKIIILAILLTLALYLFTGCTSADRAKVFAYGSHHKITLYSGGIAVRTWHSSGAINNEEHSDGYYFMDDSTGKLIRVSGQIVIEQE